MIELGVYARLDRTLDQLVQLAIEESNTAIENGFIKLIQFNDGLQSCYEIRYYKDLANIPNDKKGVIFELNNGELSQ